jgi:hypothetical protein
MPSAHRPLVVVAVLALTAVVLAPAAVPAAPAATGPGAGDGLGQQVDADSVRMTVALEADGDARWTVTYRVLLESDNETAAFESLQDDVESAPENYTSRFGDRMRSTARDAENATGRPMTIEDVAVDARTQDVGRTYGILEYTFTWTNFAAVEGDTLRAGDAVRGLFLDGQTTFVVRWPAGYGLVDARPEPESDVGDNRSVGWSGPRDFQRDEPSVVVREGAGGDAGGLPSGTTLFGLAVVALALVAGALWYRTREDAVDDGGSIGDAEGTATGAGPDEPPEELLSNEEKVLKLVRERGGRVKQQAVVEAFDWTEAKTSQVVRDLRDAGDLEGFRLGRENVLRLPEGGEEDDT